MTTLNDRRPMDHLPIVNRRSLIVDHMATHHVDQPDLSQLVDGIRFAHRESHFNGRIRRPHIHDVQDTNDEVGSDDRAQ